MAGRSRHLLWLAGTARHGDPLLPVPLPSSDDRKGLSRKSVFRFPRSTRRARDCDGEIENPLLHDAAVLQVGGAARWVGDGLVWANHRVALRAVAAAFGRSA